MKQLLIIPLFLAAPLFAAEPAPAGAAAAEVAPCCRAALASTPPTDKSIYLLESKWTSDRRATVPLAVLRGRIQVVAMIFTHCEYACPIILHDLKALEAQLPPELRPRVDFLLVSMDPQRDTPEVLAAYREKNGLPLEHWTLLRGSADDTRELAALLGVNYAPDGRGQFAHSNLLTVVNAEGEIAFQQPGLRVAPAPLLNAIAKAAADAPK